MKNRAPWADNKLSPSLSQTGKPTLQAIKKLTGHAVRRLVTARYMIRHIIDSTLFSEHAGQVP
jgi:hypothetical protein